MSFSSLLFFLAGLALLVAGAEALVRGASKLASAFGVPSLIVGLTVVAFGTGAPEMAVSVESALVGRPDIALGNVVGSNIANILLVLGLSAVIAPIAVPQQLLRLDVPVMIAASLLCFLMSFDGRIGRLEGLALVSGSVFYTLWLVRESRKASNRELAAEYGEELGAAPRTMVGRLANGALVVVGLIMLVSGSGYVVEGAVELAHLVGLSELVIAITIVAPGTSLPELATSMLAALRGEREIAVGNVVGSNVFNILAVLGIASLVSSRGVGVASQATYFDIPVMTAVAFACLPVFFNDYRISRWEGMLFVAYYAAYVFYIVSHASGHDTIEWFSLAMTLFVIPWTVLTVGFVTLRAIRRSRART